MSSSRRPSSGGKRGRVARATSPTVPPTGSFHDNRFRDASCETAYNEFARLKISVARSVSPMEDYGVGLWALFASTGLATLLGQEFGFCSSFLLLFCSNMYEGPTARARSSISGEDMEVTEQDLLRYLNIPGGGEPLWPVFRNDPSYNWTRVNTVLQGRPGHNFHNQDTHTLCRDAYLIQHLLRTSVFPKGGDRKNITTTLSLATFYIMTGVRFDIAGAIIQLICNIPATRRHRRLKNIPFGHIIQRVCSMKYGMALPAGIMNDIFVEYFKKRDISTILKSFGANGLRLGVNIPLGDQFARPSDASSEEDTTEEEAHVAGVNVEHDAAEADVGLGEARPRAEDQPAQDHDMGQYAGHARRVPRMRPSATEQMDYLRRAAGRSERQHSEHRAALAMMREEQLAQRQILDSMAAGREADSHSIHEILRLLQAQSIGSSQPPFGVVPDVGGADIGGSGTGDPDPDGFGFGISPGQFL